MASGFVYALSGSKEGYLKLGFIEGDRQRLERRVKELRSGDPALQLVIEEETNAPRAMEKYIHDLLAPNRWLGTEWFRVTPAEFLVVLPQAREHVVNLKYKERAESFKKIESTGEWLEPVGRDRETYLRLREISGEIRKLTNEKDELEWSLQARIGPQDGIKGLFQWLSQVRNPFNAHAFKRDHPEMHRRYCRPLVCRTFKLIGFAQDGQPETAPDDEPEMYSATVLD